MTVLTTIAEIEKSDAGTARMLLEFALYEALCDEVDRVRPDLERDVRVALVEKAQQGLVHLARQPVTKASIELADQLVDLVEFGKDDAWDAAEHPRDNDNGQFIPKSGRVRSAIFNALGWATGVKDKGMGDRTQQALGSWTGPDADKYSRARSLGSGLVATNDPHARQAGTVLRLIGDIGPEAQKALEPGIRRTAYRYRGTERRPDEATQKQVAAISEQLQGPGQDQQRLQRLSEIGVALLHRQVPDRDTASISLAAGKMPPSLGLMFDQHGRLVSEAQGFNGDHYLPFDLKNLKRLHGGSYVRTRTTGGLTDEDIYTGLMTGARHLTVVSNSGVFTLEFDPSLRGGRRYSDKARQMVDRYGRLVGAIGSGELYQRKLPREQVQALRQEALRAAGGNAEQAQTIFQRREKEALAAASFTATDDDDLMAQAESVVADKQPGIQGAAHRKAVRDTFNELRAENDAKTARAYRLDGEGYKAALKALKTEFPYFIRSATFTPLQDYLEARRLTGPDEPRRPRGGSDLGYTKPGRLDPDKSGVRDEKGFKGRRVLGGSDPRLGAPRRGEAVQGGTQGASVPPQGGTDAAPRPAAAAHSVQAVTKDLLEQKQYSVTEALNKTLRAVDAVQGEGGAQVWPQYEPTDTGPADPALAASAYNGVAYAQWLNDKFDKSWTKAARFLIEPGNERHLQKAIDAIGAVEHVATQSPAFDKDDFEPAKKELESVLVLREPFRAATSPYDVPEVGETKPPGLPEVAGLELTPDALQRAAGTPEIEGATKFTDGWMGKDDESIGRQVRRQADRLKKLQKWAEDFEQPPPAPLTEADRAEAEDVAQLGENSQSARTVADMNKGWAFKRMRELLALSGAADPFAKGLAPHSSASSSRVRLADPSSPLARAVVAKLSRPSLRPVRLPASR